MSLDVPDHQGHATPRRDHVVPVAADGHALRAGQIAAGRAQPLDGGQPVRQQPLLEAAGDGGLRVVEPCPLHGLGGQPAQRGEGGALVGGEPVRCVPAEDAGADGMTGGDQRQERPGVHPVQGDARVGDGEVLGRLEEERQPRGQRVDAGRSRVEGDPLELVEEALRIARLPLQVHPALADGVQGEFPRAERGQQLLGHGPAHVLHGDRLGEHARHLHHVVQRPGPCRRDRPGRRRHGRGARHGTGGRPGLARRLASGGRDGRMDSAGQPVHIRVQHEAQPVPGGMPHEEGHLFLRQHRRPVAVLVRGIPEPGDHLPRIAAEELLPAGAEQFLAAAVAVRHTAVLVQGEQPVGQPLGGLGRGEPAGRVDEGAHQDPGGAGAVAHEMAPQFDGPVADLPAADGLVPDPEVTGSDPAVRQRVLPARP
ncbi:hypothetical protein SPURM210S_08172 [Streptomyces purpurascens]